MKALENKRLSVTIFIEKSVYNYADLKTDVGTKNFIAGTYPRYLQKNRGKPLRTQALSTCTALRDLSRYRIFLLP